MLRWDHLRVCGADPLSGRVSWVRMGSPPRVRSRRNRTRFGVRCSGITSACAEQTSCPTARTSGRWDHLRVCGADPAADYLAVGQAGSPPRVRSRPQHYQQAGVGAGITSACAEQTTCSCCASTSAGDHLRVCGADRVAVQGDGLLQGSPPRVRSRHRRRLQRHLFHGITSACAEQTRSSRAAGSRTGDHLRVCGADLAQSLFDPLDQGSPPRVRSRRSERRERADGRGITSACAEQTPCFQAFRSSRWDHLRVCGADTDDDYNGTYSTGSPPRVRSRRGVTRGENGELGITSACAEQTSPTGGRRD